MSISKETHTGEQSTIQKERRSSARHIILANGMLDYFLLLSDAQLEGIQLDVERYNNAVRNYNKYAEHLAKEFCIDIEDEMKKGHPIVFHPHLSPHSSV
jgi:hypothetical protein